ncbi:hypothetical protein [Stieleria maiorica]|uniref:hypothetical protein n=1 Tax=Stieleria maiorica TaxID=2795974 RepID=UPI0011CAE670|nr:hypothetical protein [Stieleria maiorica]
MNVDPYRPPNEEDSPQIDPIPGPSFLPATPLKTFGLAVIVFPVLGVIDLFVDTLTGVAESDAPNSLPALFLIFGWLVGGYLWFRAFRLLHRKRPLLSPTVFAFFTLPVWFIVSGMLALPIIMVR